MLVYRLQFDCACKSTLTLLLFFGRSPVPVGTVPIYEALERANGRVDGITWELFKQVLLDQAEQVRQFVVLFLEAVCCFVFAVWSCSMHSLLHCVLSNVHLREWHAAGLRGFGVHVLRAAACAVAAAAALRARVGSTSCAC